MTAQAVAAAARSMGVSEEGSERAGIAVDVLVPVLLAGALGAVRATAVRSGQLALNANDAEQATRATSRWTPAQRSRYANLDEEEALGGHTIKWHVGKSEDFLRKRLADDQGIKGATSFRSLEEAEKYISRALIKNAPDIQAWASKAKVGSRKPFTYDAGEVLGYGIPRATNTMQKMTKIRIVLKKFSVKDAVYFLLTSHPEV